MSTLLYICIGSLTGVVLYQFYKINILEKTVCQLSSIGSKSIQNIKSQIIFGYVQNEGEQVKGNGPVQDDQIKMISSTVRKIITNKLNEMKGTELASQLTGKMNQIQQIIQQIDQMFQRMDRNTITQYFDKNKVPRYTQNTLSDSMKYVYIKILNQKFKIVFPKSPEEDYGGHDQNLMQNAQEIKKNIQGLQHEINQQKQEVQHIQEEYQEEKGMLMKDLLNEDLRKDLTTNALVTGTLKDKQEEELDQNLSCDEISYTQQI